MPGVFVRHASRKTLLRRKYGVGSVLRSIRCRGRYFSVGHCIEIDVNPINQRFNPIQSCRILTQAPLLQAKGKGKGKTKKTGTESLGQSLDENLVVKGWRS